jgi:2-polyprenyl-6-methoxyphenol hydroxylase-like FAD-dependent oxidoreductase
VSTLSTTCCVVGGGPAGMMLGFLLARAGIDVVVLEKHADFLRDFRGDTIHPSTLEVMNDLGLYDRFLELPHDAARTLGGVFGGVKYEVADFAHLPTRAKFIALMPQWDFLNFLAEQGKAFPTFRLLMRTEAQDLIEENGRVTGVKAQTPDGTVDIRAGLVVGADGRGSVVRERGGFKVEDIGAPMDVLWFRLPRNAGDPAQSMGVFDPRRIFILIARGDYWQCAYIIPKGAFDATRKAGLPAFRANVVQSAAMFADRVELLKEWDQIKLLTVAVNRLPKWYRQGLLCIGDAAHAMSPIGGVGVNLAVQDAVATANLLWEPLRRGPPDDAALARVQARREFPTKVTQRVQVFLQNRIISQALKADGVLDAPLPVRLMGRFPILRRLPARMVGLGVRPERVHSPVAAPLS